MTTLLPNTPHPLPGPRLGLLSDSHGDAVITRRAIGMLVDHRVDALVHLGDLCSIRVVDELAGVVDADGGVVPAFAVPGNMDDEPESLVRYGEAIEVLVGPRALWLTYGSRSVVAHHGHVRRVETEAKARGATTILHGHTHVARDECIDGVHFVNPGALHRARTYTAAVLDLESSRVMFLEVPGRAP